MIWINIKTTTLRESEYISASPTQQATWLKLLAYCSEHENGGVIHGAGGWNERAWLFGCGITLDEVRDQCGLWRFDGTGSLAVWNYPVEKELEVVAKREAGKRGGQAKAQNRSTACSSATAQPVAQLVAKTDSACSSPPTEGVRSKVEGEGVNGKEKEGPKEIELEQEERSATPPAPVPEKPKRQKFQKPTQEEWVSYATTMPEPLTENQALGAWDYYEANGWKVGRNPMVNWQATLRAWSRRQKEHPTASIQTPPTNDPRHKLIINGLNEPYERIKDRPFNLNPESFQSALATFLEKNPSISAERFLAGWEMVCEHSGDPYRPKITEALNPAYFCNNYGVVCGHIEAACNAEDQKRQR